MIVTNHYDKSLQMITGRATETVTISEDLTYIEHLYFVFYSYPEIEKRYLPETLSLNVNGLVPSEFTILKEGDNIYFAIAKSFTSFIKIPID